ncbi:neuronal acetylcholine receptor subunit alpha-10-like [Branchiostoma floridae]|uniref:Neuronal acetylcholine receptor subunit alpha-10-like n=1 Tax=Branchiostoma floridae TaxID=7739 RepID=A0A9J7MFU0_BRAFL|nr:neuronal acetylcholine receptor subunit alpha-10-like [Branchiostoma floridae]
MEARTRLFVGTILVSVYCLRGVAGQYAALPLRKKLLENYDRRVRPVLDQSTTVRLDVDVALRQVVDLNELQEVFTTLMWLRLYWTDELLQWNTSQYDGLTTTTFHSSEVWRPDIFLINNIGQGSGNLLPVTDVSVSSEGRVAWRQPSLFSSSCKVDVSQFPYDEQTCILEFSSWLYGGNDLDLFNISATMDLTAFQQNDQFEVTHTKVERKVTFYACCPGPWPSIELHIHLKRRRLFYIVNMVVPCLDLLMLNLAAFYIPPDSGERLGFTITVLLSLVVFQQLLTTQLPATSTSTPMLGKFFTATIVLVTISLLITILVLRLSHPSHPSRPLPRWLRRLVLHYMASFFCMCNIANDIHAKKRSTPKTPQDGNNDWSDDDTGMNDIVLGSRHQITIDDQKHRSTLKTISSKVENISDYLQGKENDDEEESEWKMAALVLDRAAMLATAIASVVISLVFLL